MNLKCILAVVEDSLTKKLLKAAREAGATGSTVVTNVRGEGLHRSFGILGLEITDVRDLLLFLVEESRAQPVLETLAKVGKFEQDSGTGIAMQIDVEDALGIENQMRQISDQPDPSD